MCICKHTHSYTHTHTHTHTLRERERDLKERAGHRRKRVSKLAQLGIEPQEHQRPNLRPIQNTNFTTQISKYKFRNSKSKKFKIKFKQSNCQISNCHNQIPTAKFEFKLSDHSRANLSQVQKSNLPTYGHTGTSDIHM